MTQKPNATIYCLVEDCLQDESTILYWSYSYLNAEQALAEHKGSKRDLSIVSI